MQKPNWKRALSSIAGVMTLTGMSTIPQFAEAQETSRAVNVPAGLQDPSAFQSTPIQYLRSRILRSPSILIARAGYHKKSICGFPRPGQILVKIREQLTRQTLI